MSQYYIVHRPFCIFSSDRSYILGNLEVRSSINELHKIKVSKYKINITENTVTKRDPLPNLSVLRVVLNKCRDIFSR